MPREKHSPVIEPALVDNGNSAMSTAELRNFGLSLGLLIGAFFGVLLPFVLGYGFVKWPWMFSAVLWILALGQPTSLKRVHQFWFGLAHWLNRFTSPLLLGLIFFGLILPIGLIKRLFRASKIKLQFDPDSDSYREANITSESSRDPF